MKKLIILRIICLIFCVIYILISPSFFLKYLSTKVFLNDGENKNCKIIEIWNIDTFEGGSVSRAIFLERVAIKYEKNNEGILFVVKNLTLEQALNKINDNVYPSMFSYGTGFGKYIKNYVLPLKNYNARKDLEEYCKINNILYASPYILGGYIIISNNDFNISNENPLYTFNSNYTFSEKAIPEKYLNYKNILNCNSFDLYDGFIRNKYNNILGTQRDFYRCLNRNKNTGTNYTFDILEGYTDLIQYLSIVDKNTFDYCQSFIDFILSYDCQKSLCNINMFNVLKQSFYLENDYKNFENILNKKINSINAFI